MATGGFQKVKHRGGSKHKKIDRSTDKAKEILAQKRANNRKRALAQKHNNRQHLTNLPGELTKQILAYLSDPEIHEARKVSSYLFGAVKELFSSHAFRKARAEYQRLNGFLATVERLPAPTDHKRLLAVLRFWTKHRGVFTLARASQNSLRKIIKHLYYRDGLQGFEWDEEILHWAAVGQLVVEMHLRYWEDGTVVSLQEFAGQVEILPENTMSDEKIAEFYDMIEPSRHLCLLTGVIHHQSTTEKAAFPSPNRILTSIDLASGLLTTTGRKNGLLNPDLNEHDRSFWQILGLPELPESCLFCYHIDPAVEDPTGEAAMDVFETLRKFRKAERDMPLLIKAQYLAHVQIY